MSSEPESRENRGDWCDQCNAPQWVHADGSHHCTPVPELHRRLDECVSKRKEMEDMNVSLLVNQRMMREEIVNLRKIIDDTLVNRLRRLFYG